MIVSFPLDSECVPFPFRMGRRTGPSRSTNDYSYVHIYNASGILLESSPYHPKTSNFKRQNVLDVAQEELMRISIRVY